MRVNKNCVHTVHACYSGAEISITLPVCHAPLRTCKNRSIDRFLLVNIVMFFCGRSLGVGRKSPLTASLTLAYEVC